MMIVVDTNVLLQCRDFIELPWSEIATSPSVIIIPRKVIAELDRFKSDGNSRRANVAKRLSKRIAEAIEAGRRGGDLKGGHSWEIGKGLTARHEALDPSVPDQAIVAEALWYAQSGMQVRLLTNDTIMLLHAGDVGLPYLRPSDSWLLPNEPNTQERRISALEKRLVALESGQPRLIATTYLDSNPTLAASDPVVFEIRTASPLTDDEIEQIVADAKRLLPPRTIEFIEDATKLSVEKLLAINPLVNIRRPTRLEVDDFVSFQYPAWIERLRNYLTGISQATLAVRSLVGLIVGVRNEGTTLAKGVRAIVAAADGVELARYNSEPLSRAATGLPSPPQPPRAPTPQAVSKYVEANVLHTLPSLDFPLSRFDEDPFDFHLRSDPDELQSELVFDCQEIRHGSESRFAFLLCLPADAARSDFQLTLTISEQATGERKMPISIRREIIQTDCKEQISDSVRYACGWRKPTLRLGI